MFRIARPTSDARRHIPCSETPFSSVGSRGKATRTAPSPVRFREDAPHAAIDRAHYRQLRARCRHFAAKRQGRRSRSEFRRGEFIAGRVYRYSPSRQPFDESDLVGRRDISRDIVRSSNRVDAYGGAEIGARPAVFPPACGADCSYAAAQCGSTPAGAGIAEPVWRYDSRGAPAARARGPGQAGRAERGHPQAVAESSDRRRVAAGVPSSRRRNPFSRPVGFLHRANGSRSRVHHEHDRIPGSVYRPLV